VQAGLFAGGLHQQPQGGDHPPALADDPAAVPGIGEDEHVGLAAFGFHLHPERLGGVQDGGQDVDQKGFKVHESSTGYVSRHD
jgi:hypothetical protein